VIDFAVGETRPQLTLLLEISPETSAARLASRQSGQPVARDRFEEADRAFFERVAKGYEAIAAAEPGRVKVVEAAGSLKTVSETIWRQVETMV
jgi:dTMP kinase